MGNRISRRRNTMVCYTEPSARSLRPLARDTDTNKDQHVELAIPEKPHQKSTTTTQASKSVTQEPKTTTPESKTTAQEQRVANTSTKAAKTKKPSEPVDDADEPPTKRVTRAQLKECNIVLEKLSPGASVESLANAESPKKDGKGKRMLNETLVKKTGVKKTKKSTIKNINPEYHSLMKHSDCQICEKPAKLSIVSHYVNEHPDYEIVTSRLSPDMADALRGLKEVQVAQRIQQYGRKYHEISNFCYFCNDTKCFMTKTMWMNHMAKHTGYYQYKCNDCSRKYVKKNKGHVCKEKNNQGKIPQPQFMTDNLKAYICDLCNFVRFRQDEIVKHLRCEHEITATDKFKEIVMLSFPKRQLKSQLKQLEEERDDVSDSNDEEIINIPKRRKLITDSDNNDKNVSESLPEKKVLRSRVVHTEAFISEPKEDDGLFDKDTMKWMNDMSFSASKDGESTSRSNRAKSIAEKLSERFNSVQEDGTCKSVQEDSAGKSVEDGKTKTEPLDPMTCDEGIAIIRVTASDECPAEETDAEVSKSVEVIKGKFNFSTIITDADVHASSYFMSILSIKQIFL